MLISRTIHNKKLSKNIGDSIDLIPMINLIFLLLIFFMLTGVIKKKDILNIERPESYNGVESRVLKEENLITLDQNGKIYLNNELTDLNDLRIVSNSKIVIDIDKRVRITEFNALLDRIRKIDQTKVFIKVIESSDGD